MSPRKTILRELRTTGLESYKKPHEIAGFEAQAPKYREAINGLLRDQLISGSKDTHGNLVIGLNARRNAEIERELRPWWRAPMAWGLVVGVAVLALVTLLT